MALPTGLFPFTVDYIEGLTNGQGPLDDFNERKPLGKLPTRPGDIAFDPDHMWYTIQLHRDSGDQYYLRYEQPTGYVRKVVVYHGEGAMPVGPGISVLNDISAQEVQTYIQMIRNGDVQRIADFKAQQEAIEEQIAAVKARYPSLTEKPPASPQPVLPIAPAPTMTMRQSPVMPVAPAPTMTRPRSPVMPVAPAPLATRPRSPAIPTMAAPY